MWIQTYTGKRFPLLFPQIEDVCIEDIAHALSNLCRYTGHSTEFYCVTPETKVLTSFLEWKPAGRLKIGESLVGFDDSPIRTTSSIKSRRKIRNSVVLHNGLIKQPVYALHLTDGTILKSSGEHPWLISTKVSRNQVWRTTKDIFDDVHKGYRRYMLKFIPVWRRTPKQFSYDAGYIAGMFDGEGHISVHKSTGINGGKRKNSTSLGVGLAQNPNEALNYIKLYLDENNIKYSARKNSSSNCVNILLLGNWQDKVKFLGMIRPKRLLSRFYKTFTELGYNAELTDGKLEEVLRVEYLGLQDVVALETSTHTYFAEGFGAHNSVAQHSILVASILPDNLKLCGLLHDAAEAYIGDLSSPLKALVIEYVSIEHTILKKIAEKFVFSYPFPQEIKLADTQLLLAEKAFLFKDDIAWREEFCIQKIDINIVPLSPKESEKEFLEFYSKFNIRY